MRDPKITLRVDRGLQRTVPVRLGFAGGMLAATREEDDVADIATELAAAYKRITVAIVLDGQRYHATEFRAGNASHSLAEFRKRCKEGL